MTTWTTDELATISNADEPQLTPLRPDGTLRNPVTIWVDRHSDDLYARSCKAADTAWFRGAQATRQGRIRSGGLEADVTVADADHGLDDQIDAAYRTKYRRYSSTYVNPTMTAPAARATTTRLVPRPAAS